MSQADLALTLGWAGLGWDPQAPLGQVWPYTGSWLQGKDLGSRGIACIGGDSHLCVQARPTCGQAYVWASLPDRISGDPRGGV